ncbi:MAG: 50S ribosomal protein L6 [Hadesarchaea archaeon YNP_N21]|jgi:large subunit ribosomal protein L6|nr:MAG: 50S ribosomal protein L6 [Hadesarchaea archaeon YNP_N21]
MVREKILVPDGIEAKLAGSTVEVKGPLGRLVRAFDTSGINLTLENGTFYIEALSPRRECRAKVGTVKSHLLNMFKGVSKGFKYKLKIVYSHFPITVKVEGKKCLINNFLGERSPRVAEIVGGATVKVDGDEIIVEGIDKEEVGQTAINLELATSIKRRDPRTFQDGIYLVSKE